ncbi:GPALPP motifs-containing protein 1 [Petaurus breviceps papuanus]|uniref:GPALPP motifs-containing protein 1 n=1 Tax=Petaurus breviceps papuanus TaxID=3040969 RepID=UPI0036DB8706
MARDLIGPALPPGFNARGTAEEEPDLSPVAGPALPPDYKSSSSDSSSSDEDSDSPLPHQGEKEDSEEEHDAGPTPRKQRRNQNEDEDDDDDGFFGPALPPGFKKQDDSPQRPIIGPALPPGFKRRAQKTEENRDNLGIPTSTNSEGTESSEDDEAIIGPMPIKGPVDYSVTKEFERRAQRMKEKLTKGDDDESRPVTRESWMTELPPELKGFGLGPRTFKRRADDKSGDRSVWTDTPADKERKAKEAQDAKKQTVKGDEERILSGRDKRLAEQVSSYNDSKRSESLMDIHHKKLKNKTAEDKNKPQERRPFDRDQDLKVSRFDEAQKKALIKKSRELNSRFSHGKGDMFL